MSKLSPRQMKSRLRLDYRIATGMRGPTVSVEAYASLSNLQARRHRIATVNEAGKASHYLLDYHVKSLIAKGKFHDRFTVSIDLLSGNNYPFSAPNCQVISTPIPWSPHFTKGAPVCLGEFWPQQGGHATLGHLIIHIAKLLNFDEPPRDRSYGGWNRAAVVYWRNVLKHKPITPGLAYPGIPREILDSTNRTPSQPAFRALKPPKPVSQLFKPTLSNPTTAATS